MLVNQVAVFLENRKGRLHALLQALSEANVNVESLNIADTRDFGIVRLITDNNDKAVEALEYVYSYSRAGGKALILFKTDDAERAQKLLG